MEKLIKCPPLVEQRQQALQHVDPGIKPHLGSLMTQFEQLKKSLKMEQSKLFLLESLATGDVPDSTQIGAEFDNFAKNGKELKEQLRDAKDNVEELADQAETLHTSYKEVIQKLQIQLDKVKAQQKKLGDLKEKSACIADVDNQESSSTYNVGELQEKHSKLQCLDGQLQKAAEQLEQHIEELEAKEAVLIKCQNGSDKAMQWLHFVHGIMTELTGIRVKSTHDMTLTVEYTDAKIDEHGVLELSMKFALDKLGTFVLSHAWVNVPSLPVDSIVQEAVHNNSIPQLVIGARTAWLQHFYILREVENLRNRFALDWIDKEGLVKVLYGLQASIICTLRVEPQYPVGGSVTLTSITGLPDHLAADSLQPDHPLTTLTEWLEHIQEKLTSHGVHQIKTAQMDIANQATNS